MKLYVLLIEDRHCDPQVRLFQDRDKAVATAIQVAEEYCHEKGDIEMLNVAGWIYFATYSCEGDSVRVTEEEVDK